MKVLVLGGARSGKSAYAQRTAQQSGKQVIYIATAQAGDEEMAARIEQHRNERPTQWTTVEAPLELVETLKRHALAGRCVIVDCLTLWLSNLLHQLPQQANARLDELIDVLPALEADLLFVSNEVGLGLVPMGELNRSFVDQAGRLHQRLAQVCDEVIFMLAGLPMKWKG